MLASGAVLRADPFTFTAFGDPWLNQQWGTGIVVALVQGAAGWGGLSLLRTIMIALIVGLVFVGCRAGLDRRRAAYLTLAGFLLGRVPCPEGAALRDRLLRSPWRPGASRVAARLCLLPVVVSRANLREPPPARDRPGGGGRCAPSPGRGPCSPSWRLPRHLRDRSGEVWYAIGLSTTPRSRAWSPVAAASPLRAGFLLRVGARGRVRVLRAHHAAGPSASARSGSACRARASIAERGGLRALALSPSPLVAAAFPAGARPAPSRPGCAA
jgi:hypothetical protein